MRQVSQAPRCTKCGQLKKYDMHRGSYQCLDCPGRASSGMPVHKAGLKGVAVSQAKRVEVPLAVLEETLKAEEESARRVTIFDCKSCGAQVETPLSKEVSECLFCGRKTVLHEKAAETNKHQVLIPFRVSTEEAVEEMKEHLGTLWLRPTGVAGSITPDKVRKVYLPFWCYDVNVETDWNGTCQVWEEPGFFRKMVGAQGRYRSHAISGYRKAEYDDWLVCGSKALEPKILRQLEPFDTEGASLRQLDDDLDGVPLEVGSTSVRLGWKRAQLEIRANEHDHSFEDGEVQAHGAGGQGATVKGVVQFGEPLAKSAILPVYIFNKKTAYGTCRIVVNGETGKVGSLVPYSWVKLIPTLCLLLCAFAIAVAVTGGLLIPAMGAYFLYKWWKGKGTVEQRAAKFPGRGG